MAQICTKSFVDWGFAPDPLAGLTGPTSKGRVGGRGGRGRGGKREGRGGEGRGKGGKGRGGEGRDLEVPPPQVNFLDPPMKRDAD